ncbi:MAG: hypothetical protein ACFFAH_07425 [Promethearchaeota archaeon]
MYQLNNNDNNLNSNSKNDIKNHFPQKNYLQSNNYSPLLNYQALVKSVNRNVWGYELKSMLRHALDDIHELKQNLKFKVSGKILGSSTYVLKTKTNKIINTSIETQEDIREIQKTDFNENNNNNIEYYDDESELFEAFAELESNNLLSEEEKRLLKEEKIKRALDLDIIELNHKIKNKTSKLNNPPKLIYKKVELKDLADALTEVLKAKDTSSNILKPKKKLIDNSKLTFLPEKLITDYEQKRANFEKRISLFYKTLKIQYKGEPIQFLKLVSKPTPRALVEALLCVLHLINHKKIELWKQYNKNNGSLKENVSENSGQNLFLSPI